VAKQNRPELKRNKAQRKLHQNIRAQSRMFAAQAEMRLNPFLPRVQILLHLTAQNLAELRVDTADVGGHRGHHREHGNESDLEQSHGLRLRDDLPAR
jgi:hypothetical protein